MTGNGRSDPALHLLASIKVPSLEAPGGENLRFRRFTDEYLKTGNAYQAAIAAGYSRATAEADSYKQPRLVKVKMTEAFRASGVTEVWVARKLKDLLEHEDSKIRLDTLRECLKLLAAYPAPGLANEPNVRLAIYSPEQKSLSDYRVIDVEDS